MLFQNAFSQSMGGKSTTLLQRITAKPIFFQCCFLNGAFACEMKQLSLLKPQSIFATSPKKGTEDKLFFFNILIGCSDSDIELLLLIASFKGNSCEHKLTCFSQEVGMRYLYVFIVVCVSIIYD